MDFLSATFLWAVLLCLGMLGSIESGYRFGKSKLTKNPEDKTEGYGRMPLS